MGSDPMVKKSFSHYAPRPLQQPQMPDMKQVKRSICNYIRHFSHRSFPLRQFRRTYMFSWSYELELESGTIVGHT